MVTGALILAVVGALWGVGVYCLWVGFDDPGSGAWPIRPVWLVLLSGRKEPGGEGRPVPASGAREERSAETRVGGE